MQFGRMNKMAKRQVEKHERHLARMMRLDCADEEQKTK